MRTIWDMALNAAQLLIDANHNESNLYLQDALEEMVDCFGKDWTRSIVQEAYDHLKLHGQCKTLH